MRRFSVAILLTCRKVKVGKMFSEVDQILKLY
jgi:hypothetical protein